MTVCKEYYISHERYRTDDEFDVFAKSEIAKIPRETITEARGGSWWFCDMPVWYLRITYEEKESEMSYYDWLVLNYYGDDSPIGDFVFEAKNDPNFPKGIVTKKELQHYILESSLDYDVFYYNYQEFVRRDSK